MTARDALRAMRERAEAATEGPWSVSHIERGDRFIETPESRDAGEYPAAEVRTEPDAEFIAHARTDVPALVKVVEAVLKRHQPGGTVIRETSYDMDGPVTAGATIRLSGFQTRDLETCKGCSRTYPCPTVKAINEALEGR